MQLLTYVVRSALCEVRVKGCLTVQCAVIYSAVKCTTVQNITVQCIEVQYSIVQCGVNRVVP